MADGVFDFLPARNFTQARKAAQRFFCAPTSYSTMLLTKTDIVTVKELAADPPPIVVTDPPPIVVPDPPLPDPPDRPSSPPPSCRPGRCCCSASWAWAMLATGRQRQASSISAVHRSALASDMVGPVLALGVRIVTAAGWLKPGCGAPWAAARKRGRVTNRVRGHRTPPDHPPNTTLFMICPGASVNKPVTTSARVKIQIIAGRWRGHCARAPEGRRGERHPA